MKLPWQKSKGGAAPKADGSPAEARRNLPAEGRALFANPSNDITIPHYTRTLRPTDDLLIRRGQGIELYREVQRDGRAQTVLEKRKRALVAREWEVIPASEDAVDQRAAKIVEAQLERINFDKVTLGLLDAILMGFSLSEIVWERDGNLIQPARIKKIDQRRITFDPDWNPRLLTREQMMDGLDFPARKAIVHRHDVDEADPYGVGLGRILFWHVLFKREGVAFWMKALERFAIPVPVAKYPFGTLPADQQRLLDALSGAATGGALAVPAGTEISFAQAFASGTITHEGWCRYWDEQSSEVVLGETLTTNIGGAGSRAAAQTHRDLRDELIDGDADLLTDTLHATLFAWLTEYNVPDAQPPRVERPRPASIEHEETALNLRSDRRRKDLDNLAALKVMGWAPVDEAEVVHDIMGVALKAVTPAGPLTALLGGGDPPGKPHEARPSAAFAGPDGPAGPPEAIAAVLLDRTRAVRAQWIGVVRTAIDALVRDGGSLKDLPARLLDLYPELATDALTGVIAEALAVADLRGRAEVVDGGGV